MENKEQEDKITTSGCVAGLQFIIALGAVGYGIYIILSI